MPTNQSHCHCEICRRASGAAFVSWATFLIEGFAFTDGCPDCGSQLTFQFHHSPDTIDVTLASLDHPENIVPLDHIWTKRQIPWIKLADGLPRFSASRDDRDE